MTEASAAESSDAEAAKARAGRAIVATYLSALLVACVVGFLARAQHPLLMFALADVAATVVVFIWSSIYRNSSFYDPYWSIAPMVLVVSLALHAELTQAGAPNLLRLALVSLLVWWWGARLTYNWWRGFAGLHHEDWRYVDLRAKTGRLYPLVDLLGIHMFPTLQVFAGCVPLFLVARASTPWSWLDGLATLVTASAIWIEARSDKELHLFRKQRTAGQILNTGLWARTRHPNYLGEIGFWWGLFLFGLASDFRFQLAWLGAPMITLMFVLVSVPMLDKRSLARRPEYAEHMRRAPAIFPRLW
jgi:steroid 5-alpha reductase family enzyme